MMEVVIGHRDGEMIEDKFLKCSVDKCKGVEWIYSKQIQNFVCQLCKEYVQLCDLCHLCNSCHLPTKCVPDVM